MSTLQLGDCTEFKQIPPEQYDRNISAADDITKRPLGYMIAIAQYPGVQSEIENPCAYVKNLTSRDLEVMVSQLTAWIYGTGCRNPKHVLQLSMLDFPLILWLKLLFV